MGRKVTGQRTSHGDDGRAADQAGQSGFLLGIR